MDSGLLPINLSRVMQSRSCTLIILGNEKKRFAIYTEPHVGVQIQELLTGKILPRPNSHQFMHSIFLGLHIKIIQAVLWDMEDNVYFARLFLEQMTDGKRIILELDVRPSDGLLLALMHNAPILCKKELFEKAKAVESV